MKHKYEDYIKFIDEKIKEIRYEELLQEQLPNLIEVMVASLLANRYRQGREMKRSGCEKYDETYPAGMNGNRTYVDAETLSGDKLVEIAGQVPNLNANNVRFL